MRGSLLWRPHACTQEVDLLSTVCMHVCMYVCTVWASHVDTKRPPAPPDPGVREIATFRGSRETADLLSRNVSVLLSLPFCICEKDIFHCNLFAHRCSKVSAVIRH
jgi:hypothetical protein